MINMTFAGETTTQTVLEGMYAAEARYLAAGAHGGAGFELLAPFFSPEVVLHQADALPYGGTWRGHEGLERFFLSMSQAWKAFDMREHTFLATEGTAVVLTMVHARARATGREIDFPILETVAVVQGRITEIIPFYWDTAAIADACGL